MVTKENWNAPVFTLDHIQSTGLGSLERASLGVNIPRVRYDNGQVLVEVRNPGEWHELREFVQPASPDIIRIVRSFYG